MVAKLSNEFSEFDLTDLSNGLKTKSNGNLIRVTILHAVFSIYGDIVMSVLSFMIVPIKKMFAQSLLDHYNFDVYDNPQTFEFIYSIIATIYYFGYLIGGIMGVYLMDIVGRKGATIYVRYFYDLKNGLFSASLGIFVSICMILSKFLISIELFAIANFLSGILGATKVMLFVYLAECSKNTNRAKNILIFNALSNLLGFLTPLICLPEIFGNDKLWWCVPGIALILASAHLCCGSTFPESPRHLYITKNKRKSSMCAIIYYHGSSADLDEITNEYESEKTLTNDSKKLKEILNDSNLRFSLEIVLLSALIPIISIFCIKNMYMDVVFFKYGYSASNTLVMTTIITLITWPLYFLSAYLIEKIGRRRLFIFISCLVLLELILIASAQLFTDYYGGSLNGDWNLYPNPARWVIPGLALFAHLSGMMAHSLGLLGMFTILASDLCPHSMRALISIVTSMIFVIIIVISYPLLGRFFGAAYFFPLILFSSILIYKFYEYLPETKGLTINEVYMKVSMEKTKLSMNGENVLFSQSITKFPVSEYGTIRRK